ncbi:MAG: nicotinate phosphoribosyltransferase [Saprospiraceae bacterium]|nr:nicotinate phosphoribosyltransferase [Saprospiraceae bacterium]
MKTSFINYTASYTDLYQLTMAQVYFLQGRQNESAVFDYFFRKLPFKGGYAISAGLSVLLDILENITFSDDDLAYFQEIGFNPEFITYLKQFQFRGNIHSVREGELVFPNCPTLVVEANIIEAQIIETLVLNILNFQSLIATKASRLRLVAGDKKLIDFGLRRAQGPASYYASRAAVIGGFNATSHVLAGRDFQISVSGTMAHSFIQSMPDELSAFDAYALIQKDQCVLLVDTYDTLKSGVPNAIKIGHQLAAKGHRLVAIRLDSGDLAYLAKESRKMLDQAGLSYVKIAASNQLDEWVIKSLVEQQAPIDIYGVGTNLVTGHPDGALDGVYKMSAHGDNPTIKLSENIAKTSLPGIKRVYRLLNKDHTWAGADLISLANDQEFKMMHHPFDPYKSMSVDRHDQIPLLNLVMQDGRKIVNEINLTEIANYVQSQLKKLPDEYKRFENPHIYKVGISTRLRDQRNELIEKYRI